MIFIAGNKKIQALRLYFSSSESHKLIGISYLL